LLYLYQSNHLETLAGALNEILSIHSNQPLQAETIVVQHQGMERWLSQQIAASKGIAANLHFPLPAAFIWEMLEQTLSHQLDVSTFRQEVMLWRIMAQLSDAPNQPSMQKISHYLTNDPGRKKQFQLAQRLADLFDQYQVYRPEMILSWEHGVIEDDDDSRWQATLWQNLIKNSADHWAAILERFEQAFNNKTLTASALPKRICFFGIDALAPGYIKIIQQLGELTDIHLFQLSPCAEYWDDILPERVLTIKRKQWREKLSEFSDYFTSGNPLLASMGQAGQEFTKLTADLNAQTFKLYQTTQTSSLLATIQNDILNAYDRGKAPEACLAANDRSIQFHSCHSPMREIQVLHDRLLDLFAADPTLKPADVLVMAPDIDIYAPLIGSVFDARDDTPYLPWSITDLSGHQGQLAMEAFVNLIELCNSRYTAPDVMALLENPLIMERFGFVQDDISSIRAGIRDSGIRWGLDHNQKAHQGLDETQTHTWEFGLHRLLMSYITGPLDQPISGILPLSAQLDHSTLWLGGLAAFIDAIQVLRLALQSPHNRPAEWSRILKSMLSDFMADNDRGEHQDGLRQLRECIEDFDRNIDRANFQQTLDLNIIQAHFIGQLSTPQARQGFLKGGISFCKMMPMRALPFKVIWLLGMNDTQYPRIERPVEFDLIHTRPQLGDRSRRDSDHYLFLEILQSVRQTLCISWQGRHQKSNDALPPSVVVAELRDYIDRGWAFAGETIEGERAGSSTDLTTEHPLQAFSRRCYDGSPATASYAAQWRIRPELTPDNRFFGEPLEPASTSSINIDVRELLRFWNHPVRYFLQQRLGLNLWEDETALSESEVFSLDTLQQYQLSQTLVSDILQQRSPELTLQKLQAAGELPHGMLGEQLYASKLADADNLVLNLHPHTQHPVDRVEIALELSNCHISGWLDQLDQSGQYNFRLAKYKSKDMLQLWIQHLLLLLAKPDHVAPVSRHFASDKVLSFASVDDPQAELEPFVQFYRQGLNQPLHFFPESSLAWAKAKPDAALRSAIKAWEGGYYAGENVNSAYQIAFRGLQNEALFDAHFEQLSALFQPVLDHREERNANT